MRREAQLQDLSRLKKSGVICETLLVPQGCPSISTDLRQQRPVCAYRITGGKFHCLSSILLYSGATISGARFEIGKASAGKPAQIPQSE